MTLSLSSSVRVFVRPSVPFSSFSVLEVSSCPKEFQCCFKEVLRVFKGCIKGVSRVFQGCFKEVSRVFQESFGGVSSRIEECFKNF